jgi:hypothetical protein
MMMWTVFHGQWRQQGNQGNNKCYKYNQRLLLQQSDSRSFLQQRDPNEIPGSHCDEYEEGYLMGCCTV